MSAKSAISKEIFAPLDERMLGAVQVKRRTKKKIPFLATGGQGEYLTYICLSGNGICFKMVNSEASGGSLIWYHFPVHSFLSSLFSSPHSPLLVPSPLLMSCLSWEDAQVQFSDPGRVSAESGRHFLICSFLQRECRPRGVLF